MPPIRFLHAAGLDPDAALRPSSAAYAEVFASACRRAVETLVTEAIEQGVDFLLVSPAASADGLPDGPSLHTEAMLRAEFDRLIDHGIDVFFAVDTRTSGWERLAGRGSNVVLLTPGSFTAVCHRDGRAVGVLRCVDRPEFAAAAVSPGPEDAIELAVAPGLPVDQLAGATFLRHDYLGLGAGERESVSLGQSMAHSPGALCPRGINETGPHGATLVTLDGPSVRTEFLPTAPVRYEAISLAAEPKDGLDDLAIRMTERLSGRTAEAGERVWYVRWTIDAAGPLVESLSNATERDDLIGLLPDRIGGVPVAHEVVVSPQRHWAATDDPFSAEFATALQEQETLMSDPRSRVPLLAIPADSPHRERITRLLADIDAAAVVGEARRLGRLVAAAANEAD